MAAKSTKTKSRSDVHSADLLGAETADAAVAAASPEDTDLDAEAREFLQSANVLDHYVNSVNDAGVIGEESNVRILILVAVSRLLDKPLHAVLRAAAGAGKTNLMAAVAAFLEFDVIMTPTSITAKTLGRSGTGFDRKVVMVNEEPGIISAIPQLRQLMSEGRLEPMTARGGDVVAKARFAFIMGTTKDHIDLELESRMIKLTVGTRQAQTDKIIWAMCQVAEGHLAETPDAAHKKKVLARALTLMVPRNVKCPGVYEFIRPKTKGVLMERRAWAQFLTLVQAHALLHSGDRQIDATGAVIAELRDYEACWALFMPQVATLSAHRADRLETLKESFADAPFTAKQAAGVFGVDRDVAWRTIDDFQHDGYVVQVSKKVGRTGGTWKIADRMIAKDAA